MKKMVYILLFFTYVQFINGKPQCSNLQKIAYAIDDCDLEGAKTILAALSADERTNLMHKKIRIVQGVGFLSYRSRIMLKRTLAEQINAMLKMGRVTENLKLYVIEALLCEGAL